MSLNNKQAETERQYPRMPKKYFNFALEVFKIPSTKYNEKSMAFFIFNHIKNMDVEVEIDDYSNILISKGAGLRNCYVSHMDTVHKYPEGFHIKNDREYIYAEDNNEDRVGCGGDDKNGIIACLILLEKLDNVKIVFFHEEESGGTGSKGIEMDFFEDVNFLCSIDRWGNSDLITEYSGGCTTGDDFNGEIVSTMEEYGYEHTSGLFTDCFNIYKRGYDGPTFNISCGYYQHHSDQEYTDANELWNCIQFLLAIDKFKSNHKIEKPKPKYQNYNNYQRNSYQSNYYRSYHGDHEHPMLSASKEDKKEEKYPFDAQRDKAVASKSVVGNLGVPTIVEVEPEEDLCEYCNGEVEVEDALYCYPCKKSVLVSIEKGYTQSYDWDWDIRFEIQQDELSGVDYDKIVPNTVYDMQNFVT